MSAAPAPQLTVRAALTGALLGGLLALSNVYVVLKTGWSLGVVLTSTLLAWSIFRALRAIGLVRDDLGLLENTAVASVATAAAFMTGGGNMAALPALILLGGPQIGALASFAWFVVIAALGVLAAIPLKRQLIDEEHLPFPSSIAAAATLRVVHGAPDGGAAPRHLLQAAVGAVLLTLARQLSVAKRVIGLPPELGLPFSLGGLPAARYTLAFDGSLVLMAGGALMQLRTAVSMLVAALLGYGVLAPALVRAGVVATVDYKSIVQQTVWPGAALLVASGLTGLALQGRTLVKAALGLRALLRPDAVAAPTEAPVRWFLVGTAVLAPVAVGLMWALFGVPLWAGALAIPLALVVAVVSARVNGETDVTPTKAVGPATQLLFGALLPGNLTANVMGANVTAGVGLHAADLLSDVKVGQVLGASARPQVIAQLIGVVVGAAVVVPAFHVLVPDPSVLGTPEMPAPAVMVWAGVSKALVGGLGGLSPFARTAAGVGAAVGVTLAILERVAPPRWRAWVPSPSGVGIALVMPASSAIGMCTGALFAAALRRFRPTAAAGLTPIAAGLIAGESLTGMALALARAFGVAV